MSKHLFFIKIAILISISLAFAQQNTNRVYVDNGILKWTGSNAEVALFGVNYSTPFAHAYRSIKKLGFSHKDAIDMDVSHFARLELDAYRIHVWDREVSDSLGNLLENEHMELLDYLIYKLKEKKINILLTPIAWWGTGWPEPDPETPGFSSNNSKVELITRPAARLAQQNYISQFLNHTNKYNGISYKDDPDIIAFEIINEPGHPSDTAMVTDYINEMATVFREQGVTKPLYYNISQNWSTEQAAAVYRAEIDGISFQWYPTGLVKNSELTGNYLAHVDHYPVPAIEDPKFKNKTRMVYEFDAADIALSVMYPAMARSFREAGMQWATLFSYDPTCLAAFNTEYNTHYVNLLYTPQKAISLMIAANLFRTVKTYQKFPSYPHNRKFEGFKISYEENLAELNNGEKFYYSNSTTSFPHNFDELQHIAGYGSSKIVQTDARGAYFIDRMDDSSWRLELYPDVQRVGNPFGKNSLQNKVRVLLDNSSSFTLDLPGLGTAFYVKDVKDRINEFKAQQGSITVKPGVYILSHKKTEKMGVARTEYAVPDIEKTEQRVSNLGPAHIFENQSWQPAFQVISSAHVDSATLYIRQPGWRGFKAIALTHTGKNHFSAEINENIINGITEYCISVNSSEGEMTYPAEIARNPNAWDYFADQTWKLKIFPENASLSLFNPAEDVTNLIFGRFWGSLSIRSSVIWDEQLQPWYNLELYDFKKQVSDFTFQIELDNKSDVTDVNAYQYLEFDINTQNSNLKKLKFQLINSDYQVLEREIIVTESSRTVQIPLSEFDVKEFVLLPRPYPHFLPYSFKAQQGNLTSADRKLSFIQLSIPFDEAMDAKDHLTLQLGSVRLVKKNNGS